MSPYLERDPEILELTIPWATDRHQPSMTYSRYQHASLGLPTCSAPSGNIIHPRWIENLQQTSLESFLRRVRDLVGKQRKRQQLLLKIKIFRRVVQTHRAARAPRGAPTPLCDITQLRGAKKVGSPKSRFSRFRPRL